MNIVQTFIFDETGRNMGSYTSAQPVAFSENFSKLKAYVSKSLILTNLSNVNEIAASVMLELNGKTYLASIRRIRSREDLFIVDVYG
ncbi:hypothetical protein DN730_14665 [Marinomonas piezotolerans]|uniref:Uncharacterized protein n=1 Tax=Marinomonas piezotolerans TaxID=2213058 RepID=A0A370U623_9GAMM|nr:hypothetical protein [Marinomonas piezotolerans]RDL43220.1 hypothetical protein DN730_14665 [Marinomonas piezotolerans]